MDRKVWSGKIRKENKVVAVKTFVEEEEKSNDEDQ